MNGLPYFDLTTLPDVPTIFSLIDHRRGKIVATIRMRPSTAITLNKAWWMRVKLQSYVIYVPEGFRWED